MEFLYSLSVVAPTHCILPRDKAGFSMFAASMEPGAEPAPTMVCISSMKMMMSGLFSISLIRVLMRSSNCPRYLVPATMPAMSRAITRLLKSTGEVCFLAMNMASPSTMALLPTPGSPMSIGLFFFLRHRISVTRLISSSLPTTAFVRSVPKLSSIGVLLPVCFVWVAE